MGQEEREAEAGASMDLPSRLTSVDDDSIDAIVAAAAEVGASEKNLDQFRRGGADDEAGDSDEDSAAMEKLWTEVEQRLASECEHANATTTLINKADWEKAFDAAEEEEESDEGEC